MVLSKTEVNLRRLLESAHRQNNNTKLIHYITTLREQLEQLGLETTQDGATSVSKAKLNEYSEKIEALANRLVVPLTEPVDVFNKHGSDDQSIRTEPAGDVTTSAGLRKRTIFQTETRVKSHETADRDSTAPVKLDESALTHIEKHRKLQENLTDEMVILAKQLKESSLMMNQSLQDTEKVLDSTEKAVEHSLASTNRVNTRAMEVYSHSFKTTCFQWIVIFVMISIFIMVVLLIRVT